VAHRYAIEVEGIIDRAKTGSSSAIALKTRSKYSRVWEPVFAAHEPRLQHLENHASTVRMPVGMRLRREWRLSYEPSL